MTRFQISTVPSNRKYDSKFSSQFLLVSNNIDFKEIGYVTTRLVYFLKENFSFRKSAAGISKTVTNRKQAFSYIELIA